MSGRNGAEELQEQLVRTQETVLGLQAELADTNRGLVALALEMEQRVDERNAELHVTHEELKKTNSELLQLTLALEDRVAQRTAELEKERSLLEARVKYRTAELESANKELEAFSYSVSHDLRAPLRHIDGWSMVLLEDYAGKLDERGQAYLKRVHSEVARMDHLINDLLELSRLGRRSMERTPADLAAMARTVVSRLRETDPNRNVEVIIADSLPVEGDEHLLDILLTNLLGNAWKFTSTRPKARIEVGRMDARDSSAFFIRDNGVGFDMSLAADLGRPFLRLHPESLFPGTGVGLAIVQRIVDRHGGRLWADAEVDKGATFYFTLTAPV